MTKKTTWVGALLVSLIGAPLLAQAYGAVADIALSGVMRTFASANIGIAVLALLQGVSLALLGKHQATRRPHGARAFWAVFGWYLLCAAVFSTKAAFLPDAPRGALFFVGWLPSAYMWLLAKDVIAAWPLWIPALGQGIVLAGFYYGRRRAA
ncbi:hypothetical protein G9X43_17565 [Cronobacter turicensis]|uniref:hypothetical protein n=1 Tax=Cronobacter turicensis TaxID=413502 RepID=UPI0014131373|nr:hypothetical protein [Cronobacter turicensis]NHV11078.1 hypothetical protein [Cronobacter turicensis]NHV64694.1 hypothetical protein [Cronobacter turicensis]NHW11635.1 hypothetical protein [Cronobacter turicensis]